MKSYKMEGKLSSKLSTKCHNNYVHKTRDKAMEMVAL